MTRQQLQQEVDMQSQKKASTAFGPHVFVDAAKEKDMVRDQVAVVATLQAQACDYVTG